jgi:hypothetical protein
MNEFAYVKLIYNGEARLITLFFKYRYQFVAYDHYFSTLSIP